MAEVLSTKKARKRLVYWPPAVILTILSLYGGYVFLFKKGFDANGFDKVAVIVAIMVLFVGIATAIVYFSEMVYNWIKAGK